MDETWQFIFYLSAVAIWLLCWLKQPVRLIEKWDILRLACLGWALFGFPFVWNAGEAAW